MRAIAGNYITLYEEITAEYMKTFGNLPGQEAPIPTPAPLQNTPFASPNPIAPSSNAAKKLANFLDAPAPSVNITPATPPQNKANAGSTPFKPASSAIARPQEPDSPPATQNHTKSQTPSNIFASFGAQNDGFKPSTSNSARPSGIASAFGSNFGKGTPAPQTSSSGFVPNINGSAPTLDAMKKRLRDSDDDDADDNNQWKQRAAEKKQEHKTLSEEAYLKPTFLFGNNGSTNGTSTNSSRSVSPTGSVLDGPMPAQNNIFNKDIQQAEDVPDYPSDEESPAKPAQEARSVWSLKPKATPASKDPKRKVGFK